MPKYKTLKEAYKVCFEGGQFTILKKANVQRAKDLLSNAQIFIRNAEHQVGTLNPQSEDWMVVYINYYESLRMLTESYLLLHKMKVINHQCLFAYLCMKFLNLELNWDFFEKVRTKRNGVNYYGNKVTYDDWKEVKLQFNLYISTLKKEIGKNLQIK